MVRLRNDASLSEQAMTSALDDLRGRLRAAKKYDQHSEECWQAADAITELRGELEQAQTDLKVLPIQEAIIDSLRSANEQLARDKERLEYLCRNMPGRAASILLGVMADTGDMTAWRARIDAALSAAQGGDK